MSVIEIEVREPRSTQIAPKIFRKSTGGKTYTASGYSLFVNDVEIFRMYSDTFGKPHFVAFASADDDAGIDSISLDAIGSELDLGDCEGCKPKNG